jgi:hypothetical protein
VPHGEMVDLGMVGEVPARGLMDGFRSASGWPYGLRPVPFAPGFSEAASDSFDSIKPGLGRELLMLPRGSSWSSGLILVERAPQPRGWVLSGLPGLLTVSRWALEPRSARSTGKFAWPSANWSLSHQGLAKAQIQNPLLCRQPWPRAMGNRHVVCAVPSQAMKKAPQLRSFC